MRFNKRSLKIALVLLGLIQFCELNAQNYINNPGFEDGDHNKTATHPDPLNCLKGNGMNYIDYWEKANGETTSSNNLFHSPDWFRIPMPGYPVIGDYFIPVFNSNVRMPWSYTDCEAVFPHSGEAMILQASYELIQQDISITSFHEELEALPEESRYITIKFWYHQTPKNGGGDIKFFFSKNKTKYKNNTPSSHYDWISNSPSHYFLCNAANENIKEYKEFKQYYGNVDNRWDIDVIPYTPSAHSDCENWQYYEKTFPAPSNIADFDWIVFDHTCTGYVFLDDIELNVSCPDDCKIKTDGSINITTNGFISNTSPFVIHGIENVNDLTLEVYTSIGQLTFTQQINCSDGISHDLFWNGYSSPGNPISEGIYSYRITATNDCGTREFTGKIQKVTHPSASSQIHNFNQQCISLPIDTPEPCCNLVPDFNINSVQFNTNSPDLIDIQITENIYVSTAASNSSDAVVINSNTKLSLKAGSQITLGAGFYAKQGSMFLAKIESCGEEGPESYSGDKTDNDMGYSSINSTSHNSQQSNIYNDPIRVFPNPSTNIFNISGLTEDHRSIVVYDIMGKQILERIIGGTNQQFSLSGNEAGVYILKIIDVYGKSESHRLIKTK